MILPRWYIPAILVVLLACVSLPINLGSNPSLSTSTPSSSSKPRNVQPTENENTPEILPAEMGTAEPEKPSLELVNTYVDPENLYKVNYPAGWSLSRTGGWEDICMDHEKFVCFHVQTEDLNGRELNAFMNDTYEIFKSTVGDYRMLKREEILLVGYPAVMFEQSYTWHNGYNQGFAAYLINRNKNTGYSVQAEIVENMDNYDLIYETLRKMVYSFLVGELKDFP